MPLDEASALECVACDRSILRELIVRFGQEGPLDLAKVVDAVANRDPMALQLAACRLRGSVAIFSENEVYEAALALERLGRSDVWDGVETAVVRLRTALAALLPELESLAKG